MPPWRIYVEKARHAALGITVTVAFAAGGLYVFSNATYYGLRKFKRRLVERDDSGRMKEISNTVENIIWQTLDDANVSGYQRGNLIFFPSRWGNSIFGNFAEPVWKGSLYMRSGAAVGLPFYYRWEHREDVNMNNLANIWNLDISAMSERDRQELGDCCILSPDARRYAMARALSMMYNNEVLYGILHFEFFLFSSLMTATYFWNAHARSWLNFAGFLANITLWRVATLWYRKRIYYKAVVSATALSPEIAKGSSEFYEKTIRLNNLLNRLKGTIAAPKIGTIWAMLFSLRPPGMSLEREQELASETRAQLEAGQLPYKPLCRGYVAAGKRMAMPPVPILPTSEAVSEPEKFLRRSGYEGDLEKELLSGPHFRHLQQEKGGENEQHAPM